MHSTNAFANMEWIELKLTLEVNAQFHSDHTQKYEKLQSFVGVPIKHNSNICWEQTNTATQLSFYNRTA